MSPDATHTIDKKEAALMEKIRDNLARLGIEPKSIKRIGKGFNNSMHLVNIHLLPTYRPSLQPKTIPIPPLTTQILYRVPNPATEGRIDLIIPNEVIVMDLVREAGLPVAEVYDWGVEEGGWTILELLGGENLAEYLETLYVDGNAADGKSQDVAFDAIAEVVKKIKEIKLPDHIRYGGFCLNDKGQVESGETSLGYGGPHDCLADLYREMINKQLLLADKSAVIGGWRDSGLRERLEMFLKAGLDQALKAVVSERPILVHGDLGSTNILWDREKQQVTGIVDFEWAHTAGMADEWFYSFGQEGGMFNGLYTGDEDEDLNTTFQLQIYPASLPPLNTASPSSINFQIASKWDSALHRAGASKPSIIPHMREIANLYWMGQEICQWWFCQERMLRDWGEVKVRGKREKSARR